MTQTTVTETYSEEEVKEMEESFMKKHGMSIGLATIGSAAGLIYGVTQQKRWWVVILLMIGGSGLGKGLGYIADSKK